MLAASRPLAFSGAFRTGPAPVRVSRCRASSVQAKALLGWQPVRAANQATSGVVALTASAMVLLSGLPAAADMIQTVSPEVMVQMARPLPKQQANKGKVWVLLAGGAAVLFLTTVVAENNGEWFPAIRRANDAIKAARQAAEEREAWQEAAQASTPAVAPRRQQQQQLQQQSAPAELPDSSMRAVEAGLAEARARAAASATVAAEEQGGTPSAAEEAAAGSVQHAAEAGVEQQPRGEMRQQQQQQQQHAEQQQAVQQQQQALGSMLEAQQELRAVKDELKARS